MGSRRVSLSLRLLRLLLLLPLMLMLMLPALIHSAEQRSEAGSAMEVEQHMRQETPVPQRSVRRIMRRRASGEPAPAHSEPPEPAAAPAAPKSRKCHKSREAPGAAAAAPAAVAENAECVEREMQRLMEQTAEAARAGFARDVMPRLHGIAQDMADAADEAWAAAQHAGRTLHAHACLQSVGADAQKVVQRTLEEMRACVERVEQEGEQLAREAGRLVREIEIGLRRIREGFAPCDVHAPDPDPDPNPVPDTDTETDNGPDPGPEPGPDPGPGPGPGSGLGPDPGPDPGHVTAPGFISAHSPRAAAIGVGDHAVPFSAPETTRSARAKPKDGKGVAEARGERRPCSTGDCHTDTKQRQCRKRAVKANKNKQSGGSRVPQRDSKRTPKTTKRPLDDTKNRKFCKEKRVENNDAEVLEALHALEKRLELKRSCKPYKQQGDKVKGARSVKGLRDGKLDNKATERSQNVPCKAKKHLELKVGNRDIRSAEAPGSAMLPADGEEPVVVAEAREAGTAGTERTAGTAGTARTSGSAGTSGTAGTAGAAADARTGSRSQEKAEADAQGAVPPRCERQEWRRALAERKKEAYRQLQELLDSVPDPEGALPQCAEAALRNAGLYEEELRRRLLLCTAEGQGHDEI